jgi:hypothetical protein
MVEDAITDGRRIAELLASELTGSQRGPLGCVTVVDADPDAEPTPDGTVAYGIALDGTRVGTVELRPTAAVVTLAAGVPASAVPDHAQLTREADGDRLVVGRGAAVKAARDAIEAALDA